MILSGVALAAVGGGVGGAVGHTVATGVNWVIARTSGQPGRYQRWITVGLVVTLVIIAGRLAPEMLGSSTEQELDASNPEFVILHKYYPTDYAKIVGRVKSSNGDMIGLHNEVTPIISRIVAAHVKQLDDDSAALMFDVAVAQSRLLLDRDPVTCLSMLTGGTARVDVSALMTPEMKQADSRNTITVLEQIATRPAAPAVPLSPDELHALALAALNRLPEAEQQMVTTLAREAKKPATDAEAHAMCGFNIYLFSGALQGPKGTVRRLLAAS